MHVNGTVYKTKVKFMCVSVCFSVCLSICLSVSVRAYTLCMLVYVLPYFCRGAHSQHSAESDNVVVEKEAKQQLWVDQYSPQHFTELLSDDVRT